MAFLDIPAPHGHLEALYWEQQAPRAAVVVCHPHPQHGGTMHNHVTYRVAQAFRDAGAAVIRFNFRGVGRSTGHYGEGVGELEDARRVLEHLRQTLPDVPLHAAGFSFGSRTALQLARDGEVLKVLAVGMAVDLFDFSFVRELTLPKAFIHAERDEYGKLEDVRRLVESCPDPKRLFEVPDSDHLATGRLDAFLDVARQAVDWLLAA